MNNAEYEALEGIRRSDLWRISETPMHFKYHLEHPEEPTPALLFGQAMHTYLLEPERFAEDVAVAPDVDRRTKEGRNQYAQFLDIAEGKTTITSADLERIVEMRKALDSNPDVVEILDNIVTVETPFTWADAETGEPCKIKVDMIANINGQPYVVDYKTTASCADGKFESACRRFGYDFQSGMYTEGVNVNTFEAHGFIFIAQEKDAPYACRVYYCDEGFIERGKRIFHDLLERYHHCKVTDTWEGYESVDLYSEGWI